MTRQSYFYYFIDLWGNRSATVAAITLPLFSSRWIRVGFGLAPGEGSGLPLGAPLRFF
jgi:hypothetical protein